MINASDDKRSVFSYKSCKTEAAYYGNTAASVRRSVDEVLR